MVTPHSLAYIGGLPGGGEFILIFAAVLLLFGAKNIPKLARTLGKTMEELRKATREVHDEILRVGDDEPEGSEPRRLSASTHEEYEDGYTPEDEYAGYEDHDAWDDYGEADRETTGSQDDGTGETEEPPAEVVDAGIPEGGTREPAPEGTPVDEPGPDDLATGDPADDMPADDEHRPTA